MCAYLWWDYLLDDDTEIVRLAGVPHFWPDESIPLFHCSLLRPCFRRRDAS